MLKIKPTTVGFLFDAIQILLCHADAPGCNGNILSNQHFVEALPKITSADKPKWEILMSLRNQPGNLSRGMT
jgi:hypothetical protein